jgi:hypothetical protein
VYLGGCLTSEISNKTGLETQASGPLFVIPALLVFLMVLLDIGCSLVDIY